ncbi:unnamed protein product [Effrenium voratum]|uniref:Uncharacterized protein n=1 Tax=Effrenium voratum TaxID=2562239 RepID=A0AA36N937_9DINO|nr:unnamed protein product [Effrenium voratum]
MIRESNYTEIHCRELELGITAVSAGSPLLWVDDEIFNEDFSMQGLMQDAQTQTCNEVKFILKPSTELAEAYLQSPFGQHHLARPDSALRVMSDMTRHGDGRAGAKLVKMLLETFLFRGPILIFITLTEEFGGWRRGAASAPLEGLLN